MKIFTVSSALTRLCALILATFVALLAVPFSSAAVVSEVSPSLIDASKKVTLRVHKSEGDPVLQFGDPSKGNTSLKLVPLAGIDFNVQKIDDVDLTTYKGWQKVESFKIADFYESGAEHGRLGNKITATTGADGIATFKDLDIGLYFVTEDARSAARDNYSIAAPFVVALPTTNDDRDAWNYDVSVYAKDQKISPQIRLECLNSHDDLRYGLSTTLPAPDQQVPGSEDDFVISSLKISIPLDESQKYIKDTSEVYYGKRDEFKDSDAGKGPKLLKDVDYRVELLSDNVLTLVFTKEGLAKLSQERKGNPGRQVTWLFNASTSKAASQAKKTIAFRGYVTPPGYPDFDLKDRYGVATDEATQPVPCSQPGIPIIPIPIPIPIPPVVPPNTPPAPPAPTPTPTPVPPKKGLPMTGANSWLTIILGLVFVGLGIVFIRRSYQRN